MLTPLRMLLLALMGCLALHGQDPFERARPALRVQSMEDGLPSGTVYGLARDAKGRLWAGTVDGAAYYTGSSWVPVRLPVESTSQYVRAVLGSEDGSLWFATQDGGLWRLDQGTWTHFRGGRELPSDHIFSLAETREPDGTLARWVGTGGQGVAVFRHGTWRHWGPTEGFPPGTVWRLRQLTAPDGRHGLWAATETGLCVLEGDRWRLLGAAEGYPEGSVNDVLEVSEADGSRSLWLSLWNRGLSRWDGRTWTHHTAGRFPGRTPTSSLCSTRDADGRPIVWIGSLNQGLWWFRNGLWENLGRAQGFRVPGVLSLFPVADGKPTLLIGTRTGGVASLDLGGWRTLDETAGLPGPEVTCFAEQAGSRGVSSFWVGTTAGLTRFAPTGPDERIQARHLPSDYIIALLDTPEALWVGTLKGLARKDARGWSAIRLPEVPADTMIIALQETVSTTGSRTLWVGTPRGLFRHAEGRWTRLTRRDGLPQDYVSAFCAVPGPGGEPMLWVGTRGAGVARYLNGAWTTFGSEAGLANGNIYALVAQATPSGRSWLWAGTLGGGLARLDLQAPSRWEVFTRESLPGLGSNYIQRIEVDRRGRLYLSTSAGITRLTLDAAGNPSRLEDFTLGDGLPSTNTSLGASLVDRRGRIWIGTAQGAAILDPERETFAPAPPPPVLEAAAAGGLRTFRPGEDLGFRDRNLRFTFSLPVLHRKEDIRFRTRLEGLEAEPGLWQAEGWREFPTLPAGAYTLQVWARTHDGRVSGPIAFPFRVAPAPWAHPLAYLAYALGALGAGLGLLRLRTRVLRERTLLLEATVHDRTRVIQEQARDLEASNRALQGRNEELSHALAEVRTLRGLIPICAYCKKIRDDQGSWEQMERYISDHSDAQFSHGICPDCQSHHFPEIPIRKAP
ncbi:MAG: Two component regulator propeller [Acidobacteria bacterium ADurb.Bin340]|nr:MAG: Two component regulator propeller [Acidobacteria bacterium ADurb.Bin340]